MKILFYGTKDYDQQFFDKLAPEYPGISFKFIEANLYEETASLAKGYDGICAFVNADISAPVMESLHTPVSYTHLDVYKRQILSLLLW